MKTNEIFQKVFSDPRSNLKKATRTENSWIKINYIGFSL